jgi:hypothetical protein
MVGDFFVPVLPMERSMAHPAEVKPLAVTIGTARKISGLGNTTVWKLIGEGRLDTVSVGRRRLILYGSLEKLLSPKAINGSIK